jgi:hypothetical protein
MQIIHTGGADLVNLYDELPIDVLAQFFYFINKNIEKGIISKSMYYEVELIKKSVKKKGIRMFHLLTHSSPFK